MSFDFRKFLSQNDLEFWSKITQGVVEMNTNQDREVAENNVRSIDKRQREFEEQANNKIDLKQAYNKADQNFFGINNREIKLGGNAGISKKLRLKIDRGKYPIEATLDLHGYNVEKAYEALHKFILSAAAKNIRMLLVITGKGSFREGAVNSIDNNLIKWINTDKIRPFVLRINYASRHHGGIGAFYIFLKRGK